MPVRLALVAVALAAGASAPGASAQAPMPEIVGTWEMTGAENVPVDDALVFARVTITDDRIEVRSVFLDADDGELTGRIEDGRYLVNDGQLVVRQRDGLTVLAVQREATLLTITDLETGVLLRLRQADPALALDRDLVGTWTGTLDGEPFTIRFRPDGTGASRRGDGAFRDGRYVVAGPYLFLDDGPIRYTFAGGERRRLVLEGDGQRTVLSPAD